MDSYQHALALYRAAVMVQSRYPPETMNVDAVFFHARAKGDLTGLFSLAAELFERDIPHIAINGFDGNLPGESTPNVVPGSDYYVQYLTEVVGVPRDSIHLSAPASNTPEESRAFLTLAKINGWKSGVFICQPHQLLRCFLGWLKEMEKANMLYFQLFAAAPLSMPWNEVVPGSQGKDPMPRWGHFEKEYARILQYQTVEDIVSFPFFEKWMNDHAIKPMGL